MSFLFSLSNTHKYYIYKVAWKNYSNTRHILHTLWHKCNLGLNMIHKKNLNPPHTIISLPSRSFGSNYCLRCSQESLHKLLTPGFRQFILLILTDPLQLY